MIGGETQALWLWYWLPPISSKQSIPRNDHEAQGRDFRATHSFAAEPSEPGESGVMERSGPTGGPVDLPNARPTSPDSLVAHGHDRRP
jgi:hypothetical protein